MLATTSSSSLLEETTFSSSDDNGLGAKEHGITPQYVAYGSTSTNVILSNNFESDNNFVTWSYWNKIENERVSLWIDHREREREREGDGED